MNTQTRAEILAKFRKEIAAGKILVGVGADTGITAKSSEARTGPMSSAPMMQHPKRMAFPSPYLSAALKTAG